MWRRVFNRQGAKDAKGRRDRLLAVYLYLDSREERRINSFLCAFAALREIMFSLESNVEKSF